MCGIAGFSGLIQDIHKDHIINNMLAKIIHRGPDSRGTLINDNFVFGHRRLSILDLSDNGSQPMRSKSSQYVIIFNGEIYNNHEVKSELLNLGYQFIGTSDTEVLLSSIDHFGLNETLQKIEGMFAFALWDYKDSTLSLVRDRLGQKPLYYSVTDNQLIFASELKSLLEFPGISREIDKEALQLYFKYNNIPAPYSIFKKVKKLSQGSIITYSNFSKLSPEKKFWNIETEAKAFIEDKFNDFDSACTILEDTLKTVISEQMISDVKYGAFLSGGIDSSLIVSLMQSLSVNPIDTFSIGFNEKGFNEAPYAKAVANHIGTNHHELYLDVKKCLDIIPALSKIYCEPFSDSSQIPTYILSKFTKEHVTVSLSGDGGDELFGGYNRHFWINKMWEIKNNIPLFAQRLVNNSIASISPNKWNNLGNTLFAGKIRSLGDKLYKANSIFNCNDKEEIYDLLVSHFNLDSPLLIDQPLINDPYDIHNSHLATFEDNMFITDQFNYLSNDILTKVDRASMANSLETRVPFIDKRIFELSWRFTTEQKILSNTGKMPLRKILNKYVPDLLINRPKVGFGVPLDSWLRNELRDWAESLLNKEKIVNAGLLNYDYVKQIWDEHLSGATNWQYHIWDILMFQAWYEEYKE